MSAARVSALLSCLSSLPCPLVCFRTPTKLNILMEYVPGKSLDSLLEKFGSFSEKVISESLLLSSLRE